MDTFDSQGNFNEASQGATYGEYQVTSSMNAHTSGGDFQSGNIEGLGTNFGAETSSSAFDGQISGEANYMQTGNVESGENFDINSFQASGSTTNIETSNYQDFQTTTTTTTTTTTETTNYGGMEGQYSAGTSAEGATYGEYQVTSSQNASSYPGQEDQFKISGGEFDINNNQTGGEFQTQTDNTQGFEASSSFQVGGETTSSSANYAEYQSTTNTNEIGYDATKITTSFDNYQTNETLNTNQYQSNDFGASAGQDINLGDNMNSGNEFQYSQKQEYESSSAFQTTSTTLNMDTGASLDNFGGNQISSDTAGYDINQYTNSDNLQTTDTNAYQSDFQMSGTNATIDTAQYSTGMKEFQSTTNNYDDLNENKVEGATYGEYQMTTSQAQTSTFQTGDMTSGEATSSFDVNAMQTTPTLDFNLQSAEVTQSYTENPLETTATATVTATSSMEINTASTTAVDGSYDVNAIQTSDQSYDINAMSTSGTLDATPSLDINTLQTTSTQSFEANTFQTGDANLSYDANALQTTGGMQSYDVNALETTATTEEPVFDIKSLTTSGAEMAQTYNLNTFQTTTQTTEVTSSSYGDIQAGISGDNTGFDINNFQTTTPIESTSTTLQTDQTFNLNDIQGMNVDTTPSTDINAITSGSTEQSAMFDVNNFQSSEATTSYNINTVQETTTTHTTNSYDMNSFQANEGGQSYDANAFGANVEQSFGANALETTGGIQSYDANALETTATTGESAQGFDINALQATATDASANYNIQTSSSAVNNITFGNSSTFAEYPLSQTQMESSASYSESVNPITAQTTTEVNKVTTSYSNEPAINESLIATVTPLRGSFAVSRKNDIFGGGVSQSSAFSFQTFKPTIMSSNFTSTFENPGTTYSSRTFKKETYSYKTNF